MKQYVIDGFEEVKKNDCFVRVLPLDTISFVFK